MNNHNIIGIDLAKNYFQVCALNQAQKVQFNKKLTRNKFAEFIQQQEPTLVAMEACSSSNFWARKFVEMGHNVKLVPAQHVKPFVKGNKNDRNDAVAICEAALRPNMHFAMIKTHVQQDMQMIHRIRQLHVKQVTAISNQIRGYLAEYGIVVQKQVTHLLRALPAIIDNEENDLTPLSRQLLLSQYHVLNSTREKVSELNQQIEISNKQNLYCQRLQALPGVGPIISSALYAAVGNGSQFSKGRQMSAWIGLTPAHFGTGGINTNVDTTKKGDHYLRTLLIHGARTVVTWSARKKDPLSCWIQRLVARRGKRKAYVALANKLTRAAWKILQGDEYDIKKISAQAISH
ncbi:MAG TPA: IS110 family transposase [Bacteroidetes bacterium]|nr:IS110 family transposase [Bacteroidota bacterium]